MEVEKQQEEAYLKKTLQIIKRNMESYEGEVNKMQAEIDEMLEHYHDNDVELYTALTNTITMKDNMKRALMRNLKAQKKPYFGRIVFWDETEEKEEVQLTLAEPKPTSYYDYLKAESGMAVTYNNSNFELRGVKQYWLRNKTVVPEVTSSAVATVMQPLEHGSRFRGKVRFKNLTRDELGLLLWSMKLKENCWMNVGKAKAYGYGNISLQLLSVKQVNLEQAYKNGAALCLNPWEEISVEEMIQEYKTAINKTLGGKQIEELPHVKEFFMMKDASAMPDPKDIRYMKLELKEYQFRKDKVLPEIKELVKKK